ncbi:hypothetical protein F2Q69_00051612 [Brassica cretica]|uniref:Uncharacterized protein n=1 Tax=Brassica cretica TaxID=69181 RepID=A0A8S9Q4M4_BRACR|nr:hypothetical protein F2Q69_00051612 [Brassica cretica]
MIRAKQISNLSSSARSFFLGGTRSSAADGNSCASAEDDSCLLRRHQTRHEAAHTGNRVFTRLHVSPPVLPVKPDPANHKIPLPDGTEVSRVDHTLPITSVKASGREHLGEVYTTSASKDPSERAPRNASPGTKQASNDVSHDLTKTTVSGKRKCGYYPSGEMMRVTPAPRHVIEKVSSILRRFKWGLAAEEALHSSGFKMDAYQANQVLKQIDN